MFGSDITSQSDILPETYRRAAKVNGVTYLSYGAVKCVGGKGGGAMGINGFESAVYTTNGTTAGTVKLKSWSTSATSSGTSSYLPVGSLCLFLQWNGSSLALWKTTGTSKNTTIVKSFTAFRSTPVSTGAWYVFVADDGVSGLEPWCSNGTTAGTQRIADLYPGATGSTPNYLTILGSAVYFTATTATGVKLYQCTLPNTVSEISLNGAADPKWLTAMNGKLYFSAADETAGRELWVYDPANPSAGAYMVADIYPGTGSGDPNYGEPGGMNMSSNDPYLTVKGNTLYFAARNNVNDRYTLWSSDETAGGTQEVLLFRLQNLERPNSITAVGNKLYLLGYDATKGNCLYVFDPLGTPKRPAMRTNTAGFGLAQNYPNPFNPSTLISYMLPEAADVSIRVYDLHGRQVAHLVQGLRSAGTHEVVFDASSLSGGTYLYRLEADGTVLSRHMTLLK